MNISAIETFIKVAEEESFSRVAQEFNMTPSAVLKQMNQLEYELQIQLFYRTNHGVHLTEEGKSFYLDSKYLIEFSKTAIQRAKIAGQNKKDVIVRITTSSIAPPNCFVSYWEKVKEVYPDYKIDIIPAYGSIQTGEKILNSIGKDSDIVIDLFDQNSLKKYHCAALELSKMPLQCAVPLSHRLANKKVLKIEDLYNEKLLLCRKGIMSEFDRLRNDLIKNHNEIQIQDYDQLNVEICNQCENCNHIMVTVDLWSSLHPFLRILPVEWDYKISCGMLYADPPSEKLSNIISVVQQQIGRA